RRADRQGIVVERLNDHLVYAWRRAVWRRGPDLSDHLRRRDLRVWFPHGALIHETAQRLGRRSAILAGRERNHHRRERGGKAGQTQRLFDLAWRAAQGFRALTLGEAPPISTQFRQTEKDGYAYTRDIDATQPCG